MMLGLSAARRGGAQRRARQAMNRIIMRLTAYRGVHGLGGAMKSEMGGGGRWPSRDRGSGASTTELPEAAGVRTTSSRALPVERTGVTGTGRGAGVEATGGTVFTGAGGAAGTVVSALALPRM